MKKTIATMILALAAGQASAEGFYQLVVGDAPQSDRDVSAPATEFAYTPLYLQVVGNTDFAGEVGRQVPEFTYTPLYLQVAAHLVNQDSRI